MVWHRKTTGISGMFKGVGEGWNVLISSSIITLKEHPELSLEESLPLRWVYHKIH